jgi:hypothetical protein
MSLSDTLERVAELYDEKAQAEKVLKDIKQRIEQAEGIAVEQLAASGLDGVRAAGKSWYLRDFWSVSIPADRKADAVRIARENGMDDFIGVNTSSLKSWLNEQHKERGGETLAAGTPWDGIVSEYHETRLSRQTLPKE